MDQPAGTVTLFFSDIEGSTALLHELGPEAYREALAEHRRVMRDAFERHGGYEVDYEGDAFFVAFGSATEAVAAAAEAQAALAAGPIRVRMGLHTGEPLLDPPKYVGVDVHLAARVMSAGHGGQVLLTSATRAGVAGEVTDLGEHRLKDIESPVSLYQLGSEAFPPLKTISNTNLPRPVSSFVGRESEVAQVVGLVRHSRLVTLTGSGGTGKTRLAIEAAAELVPEFKAGVFWVGLAAIRDPALVVETIGGTLGAKGGLAEHIGEREMLLLIDNFEQVVEAAAELSALLAACPNLRLVVSSRERLRIQGEVVYPVPPLAEREAVELFCVRSALDPSAEIRELCRRLDDMPLAVELAAARASVLSAAQILERLGDRLDLLKGGRDADPRQQTLRSTIQWSFDLLPDAEKGLFARLAVFDGGCDLQGAEYVARADLDTLQSLVDRSLVRFTDARYWMLETIRDFAGGLLVGSPEADDLRRRHLEYFLKLAEQAEGSRVRGEAELLEGLDLEQPNLRLALRHALEAEPALAVRLSAAMSGFWETRGHWDEGRRWFAAALASADDSPWRARALVGAATLASRQDDHSAASELARACLHLPSSDSLTTMRALNVLAIADKMAGDLAGAKATYAELISVAEETGDDRSLVVAYCNLSHVALEERSFAEAESWARAGHEKALGIGGESLRCDTLECLAEVLAAHGKADEAWSLFEAALRLSCDLGNWKRAIDALEGLADIAYSRGDFAQSDLLLVVADAVRHDRSTPVRELAIPAFAALD